MTREEAIVILGNEKPCCGEKFTYTESERCEAYDMAIAALREQPRWISVEERLPTRADANPNESVLAIAKDDGFARAWIWDIVERYYGEFTYWMPLPEEPKEEV